MTSTDTFNALIANALREVRGWDSVGRPYDHELLEELADFVEFVSNIFNINEQEDN